MWNEGPIPAELAVHPAYLLARLGQSWSHLFAAALAPQGLHPRHLGVMNILAGQPGATQLRLCEYTAIDTSTMVAIIDELEAKGIAERRPHPFDRRARSIYLTAAGEEELARLRALAAKLQRDFLGALDADERRVLHELLRKVAASRSGAPGAAPAPAPAPRVRARSR